MDHPGALTGRSERDFGVPNQPSMTDWLIGTNGGPCVTKWNGPVLGRILLVDTDRPFAERVAEALQHDRSCPMVVEITGRLDDAVQRLRSADFDAVVLDPTPLDTHGLAFARLSAVAPHVPMLILSARDDEASAIAALRQGVEEYLHKDLVHLGSLPRTIRLAIARHAHRESLRSAESRYRSLVEGAVQGILIHVDGVVRFANQALAQMVGVDRAEDLVGGSIWPFVFPDDRPLVACYIQARAEGRDAPTQYELRIVRPDGEVRWMDCMVSVKVARGERTVMAALIDVTDRKRAEEHLRASEDRFRLLADNIKEAFIIVELPSGRALYLSRVWEDIWGRPVEDAYANPRMWLEAIDADDQAAVAAAHQTLQRGASATHVSRVHRPDGSVSWVRARLFPVRDDGGEAYRAVGLIEEITQMRETEEQLRQALKMEAVGRLAGGIAHDFNNLLVVIGGYADHVADDLGPTHPSGPDITEIQHAVKSAASLTRQLLAFSRRQILQPQILDVNQVLQRGEQLLRRIIGEDIALVMRLTRPLARVQVDPGQVEQILMNLAVNARDAMPHGGRLIITTANAELDAGYVAHHRGASVGPHVMIAVSDTGIGMDRATQQHLFEPFFTTKPAGRGTGLGLSTVYGIVTQSGGSIWVYSEVGRGSTFKIYLPVASARVDEPPVLAIPGRRLAGSETVLVVEDQVEVRRLIVQTLERHGYRVLAAATDAEALAAAREHPVDLLLADVILAGFTGRDVADRVLAIRPGVRVVYMSGHTDDVVVHHGMLEPGLAFLQKPFAAKALLTKIREVLDADVPPPW